MSNTQPWSDMRSRSRLRQSRRPCQAAGIDQPIAGDWCRKQLRFDVESELHASLVALARSRAWIRTWDSNQLQRHQAARAEPPLPSRTTLPVRAWPDADVTGAWQSPRHRCWRRSPPSRIISTCQVAPAATAQSAAPSANATASSLSGMVTLDLSQSASVRFSAR